MLLQFLLLLTPLLFALLPLVVSCLADSAAATEAAAPPCHESLLGI